MISVTLGELLEGKESNDFNHGSLYVLRNEDGVKYVGITERGISARWINQWGGHLMHNIYGQLMHGSHVGRFIIDWLPASLEWTLESWTPEECVEFLGDDFPPHACHIEAHHVEYYMIQKLQPRLNVMHGTHKEQLFSDAHLAYMQAEYRKAFD